VGALLFASGEGVPVAVQEVFDAGAAGEPWVGPVPGGRRLVPQWFVPALKALGVLIAVEVLVNDSGASMAVLSAACAAPLLLALAAAQLQASVR